MANANELQEPVWNERKQEDPKENTEHVRYPSVRQIITVKFPSLFKPLFYHH